VYRKAGHLSKIRVRLLGGFEVWAGDQQVGSFESQKVRALLAYLACQRRRSFSRDHLAGLLWPEREPETARHALRQAVYNLRSKLGDAGSSLIRTTHLEIGLDGAADFWLDVEAFEEALHAGNGRAAADPHHLSTAVQLYRGELLAGFFVKECPEFEDWLVAEQTRLRETAVDGLRRLIENYRRRGEYRFGVHYARRLVAIEPLSEEAHRELMRLFALSGQRNRALAHYEELLNLLREELAVEPLPETKALYESILLQAVEKEAEARSEEPIGPLIPLAGRGEGYERLRDSWNGVLQGSMCFTLVIGEGGVGKTRLIKSFMDVSTSTRRVNVLKGRCYELAPLVPYQPILEILRCAFSEEAELAEQALAAASGEVLEDLTRLVPELRPDPASPAPTPIADAEGRRRLFGSVARFLEGLCQGGDPLILFLDDLHLADRDTLDLLMYLTARLQGPVWMIAVCLPDELNPDHPIEQIARYGESKGRASRLEIGRLPSAALEEIAESLVGEAQAAELARFLEERSQGLPLAVTEIINYLWDEGILVSREAGRWNLSGSLQELDLPEDLDELIRLRVRRLPNSTKRLATLAAMMGQSFDVNLLQEAADEHSGVIDIGLEILLKRWLIRQFAHSWTTARRERDIILWAQGARRGNFEFAHKRIRGAVYRELNPLRRQAMHTQAAEALERLRGNQDPEALAFHFAAANQWEKALPHLERAVQRALSVQALDTARRYCDQAIEALSRLAAGARSEAQAARWRNEREKMREIRDQAAG
jgi:DNA-binding SARP family transcriptional activator